jgi:hypothetical protein
MSLKRVIHTILANFVIREKCSILCVINSTLMKAGQLLLWGGIIGLGITALSRKKAIGLLNFFINKVGVKFEGFTPILRVDIGILNPSRESFTIKSIAGNIISNGYSLGTVSAFDTVEIKATSQAVYPVYIRVNAIGAGADVINMITHGVGNGVTVTFKGTVNASGITAPLDISYKIF